MVRIWSQCAVAALSCIFIVAKNTESPRLAIAQPVQAEGLYYLYLGQKIPLKLQPNVIAVEGKSSGQLSGSESYSRTLKRYLRGGGTLSGDDNSNLPGVQIDSIGKQYALIGFSSTAKQEQIQKSIQAEPNLQATLPVLTLGEPGSAMLVLPNRILVNFKAGTSTKMVQETLKRQNVEIIRKETFTDGLYLVRSKEATGTAILQVANQLSQEIDVEYATPDFIQIPTASSMSPFNQTLNSSSSSQLLDVLGSLTPDQYSPTSPAFFPLQWNLDSTLLSQCLTSSNKIWECLFKKPSVKPSITKRTDIRAKEAWKESDLKGRGVLVAVIDAFVQSNHPDLASNIYRVNNSKCPKETYGWDFTNEADQGTGCEIGDPESSIDSQEAEDLREKLLDTFSLTDAELIRKYPTTLGRVQDLLKCQATKCPDDSKVAKIMRMYLREQDITGSFHGTNVAGVIAANSSKGEGLLGIAPKAKILPIRALGLGGTGSDLSIARAIGYAASRKVDIINLSLGSTRLVVSPVISKAIAEALATNPNLVIVASAGNEAEHIQGLLMSPACIPGVVSVGATNLLGKRAAYSNFGSSDWSNTIGAESFICGPRLKQSFSNLDKDDSFLDVVAPGGEMNIPNSVGGISIGGVFTTGGTFAPGLWRGLKVSGHPFMNTLDQRGQYIWTQGTSFSAPAVVGVLSLMKAEDSERKLNRQQLVKILKQTASYENLDLGKDLKKYEDLKKKGTIPPNISPNQYFFGSGLVNAEAAVHEVKRQLGK